MIELNDVSKKIGVFKLENISLEIPEGYICGLVGKNGSGKTTLLHLILGLYSQDKGIVMVDNMVYPDDEKSIHDNMGTVLVEELLDGSLSLMDNGERYGRFYSKFDKEKYKALLKNFNIDLKSKFACLSKGEKLKGQFAFALSCNPKYLILDEPTANFDPEFRKVFLKLIQDFVADEKHSVILATHITDDLDRLADYLIYLEGGKLIYQGDIESFRKRYRILSGEKYKIKLLQTEDLICIDEGAYGAKALVKHHHYNDYDASLMVTVPSIEEFMYFYSKREGGRK